MEGDQHARNFRVAEAGQHADGQFAFARLMRGTKSERIGPNDEHDPPEPLSRVVYSLERRRRTHRKKRCEYDVREDHERFLRFMDCGPPQRRKV